MQVYIYLTWQTKKWHVFPCSITHTTHTSLDMPLFGVILILYGHLLFFSPTLIKCTCYIHKESKWSQEKKDDKIKINVSISSFLHIQQWDISNPRKKRNKFNEVNKSQEVKIIRILCKYRVIPIIGESDRMALSHYNWGSELLYNWTRCWWDVCFHITIAPPMVLERNCCI